MVLVLVTVALAFFRPYFFSNDDVFSLFLLKGMGITLTPDEHLYFQNALLGLFLREAYGTFPAIPWYPLFLVLTWSLSLWAFLAGALSRSSRPFTFFLFFLYFLFIGLYFGTRLDYTMLACLAAQGGLLLWVSVAERPDRKAGLGLVLACFVAAALLRFEACFFSVLIALPWLVLTGLQRIGRPRFFGAILALVLAGLALFDHAYYQKDPGWSAFTQFNPVRAHGSDYQSWTYDASTKPFFDSFGWDELDLRLFQHWYFLDPHQYSLENLRKVVDHFGAFKATGIRLPNLFASETDQNLYTTQNILLCAVIFLLACPRSRLPQLLGAAIWVLLCLLGLAVFLKNPIRLHQPALAFLASLVLFTAVSGPEKEKPTGTRRKAAFAGLALLTLLVPVHLWRMTAVDAHFRRKEKELKAMVGRLHPTDDQLYVVWNSGFPYEVLGAFDDFELFRNFHVLSLGVFQRAPFTQELLGHFGVRELFRDMVDNPKLFMIGSPEEEGLYGAYARERLRKEVHLEKTFESPFFEAVLARSLDAGQVKHLGAR